MTTLSMPYSIIAGQPMEAEPLEANFTALETWAAGLISSDNLASSAVAAANIATGAVQTAKLADDAVTLAKLSPTMNLGSKSLTTNATIATTSLTLTDWQPITGMDLAAFTPAVDCTVFFHGIVHLRQGTLTGHTLYVGVLNGATVCSQATVYPDNTDYFPVPISGFFLATASTAYTFKVSVKSSSDAQDISILATDARCQVSAFAIPR